MDKERVLELLEEKRTISELFEKTKLEKDKLVEILKELKVEGKLERNVEDGKKYYSLKKQKKPKVNLFQTLFEIKKDKWLLALLIIIVILGLGVRVVYPTEPGLWNDDMSILPTALLWFYPHTEYPGLSGQGETAFGNYLIGKSCMLSGQDFSDVIKITPMWFANRPEFLHNIIYAEDYCRMPMYIFGIAFFLLIILLAAMLLDKYATIFVAAFVAFYQFLLQFSRMLHIDVILYTFIASGLIFLWKSYASKKYSRQELINFCIAMGFFALAFATKIPGVLYVGFAFVILLDKYKEEALQIIKKIGSQFGLKIVNKIKDQKTNPAPFYKAILYSFIAYIIVLLPTLEYNLKNVWLVIQKYTSVDVTKGSPYSSLAFNKSFWSIALNNFFVSINIIDLLVFIFSVFIFIKLIRKKKDLKERFIFYLMLFFLAALFSFGAMNLLRVFFSFGLGLIFLMALVLSDKPYSIFNVFKIKNKRTIFVVLMIVYILLGSYLAFGDAPYFNKRNEIFCKFADCGDINYITLAESQIGLYLTDLLKNNTEDTFDALDSTYMVYYYIFPEQSYQHYVFRESFRQQVGRLPTVEEKVEYFKPNNRTLRYLLIEPLRKYDDEFVNKLKNSYEPNDKVLLKHGIEVMWVYDVKNLIQK